MGHGHALADPRTGRRVATCTGCISHIPSRMRSVPRLMTGFGEPYVAGAAVRGRRMVLPIVQFIARTQGLPAGVGVAGHAVPDILRELGIRLWLVGQC